jgi:hypothetical protein
MKLKTWEKLYIAETLLLSAITFVVFEPWRAAWVLLGIATGIFVILEFHTPPYRSEPLLNKLIFVFISLFICISFIPLVLWGYHVDERAKSFYEATVLFAFCSCSPATALMFLRTCIEVFKKYHKPPRIPIM